MTEVDYQKCPAISKCLRDKKKKRKFLKELMELDFFTQKRIKKIITDFRLKTGQMPTNRDLIECGLKEDVIRLALKSKLIEEFYVTLTNGTIVKSVKLTL